MHIQRGRRLLTSAAALIVLLLSPAIPVKANVPRPDSTDSVSNLSTSDIFELADQARAGGRFDDAAALYAALARDPDPEIRAEAHFRSGTMFANAGRYQDAAIQYRALLDEKPDAIIPRLELARVLAAMGDEAGARRNLRQAQAQGLPTAIAGSVDQFARALRSPKRFGGSIEAAIAPDTNINRATQARTLDTVIAPLVLSRDARQQSGVGLRFAGQGFYRVPLSNTLAILPRVSGLANLYRSQQFQDVAGSALIGFEWRHAYSQWSPSIGRTWRNFGGRSYARTQTVALDWLQQVSPTAQIVTNGSASRVDYMRNPLQNGSIYNLNLSIERAYGARTGANYSVSATRQTAQDPGYATWAGGGSVQVWHEIGQSTVFMSLAVLHTVGDDRLFLFPQRRNEWYVGGRAGATLRQFAYSGFAPILRLGYERNLSTVGIYDYGRVVAEVGVARAF